MRRAVGVGIVGMLVLGLLSPIGGAAASPSTIQKGLLARLDSGELDRFVVEFAATADLDAAAAVRGWGARGAAVYRSLTGVASRSQTQARAVVAATPGASASSYWLTNVMIVRGGSRLAERLAALQGVTRVRAPKVFPLVEPVEEQAVLAAAEEETPWGITKIGADQAWADGVTGAGIVVANVDTGVEFDHDALVNQYRGNLGGGTFDHDYNWWDPSGICGDEPCDNVFHGTHTMGTMVGGDGPGPFTPDIGVAPGAEWIAAKGCEDYWCSEEALLSSGEFILAPTDLDGNAPDPAKRPDIVNNSWGSGPGDEFYLEVVKAWRAAGIIPVFSSGNPGSSCGDGGSPGDFLESFSVGATDVDDVIADFSGRGPSTFGKVNPDVSAPGVRVVSSVPGGDYESFSGTSMAAPHTAGTLALVLSAEPALIGNVEGATDAVSSTALDILDDQCGGDEDGDPNNVYGDGRIDALAAVALVATGGTLAGTVTDVVTDAPIAGATITATRNTRSYTAVSDDAGEFDLFLAAGDYTVTVEAFAYQGAMAAGVEIVTDETTTQDFWLAPLPQRDITGTVLAEEDGEPIEGAEIFAVGTPVAPARTAADGTYTLTLPIGDFTIRTAAGGCTEVDLADLTLGLDGLTHDVTLFQKIDGAGHGCRPVAFDWVDAATESAFFGDQSVGRLPVPFDFPFYDQTYGRVFLTDNGYLTFEPPSYGYPDPIPSRFPSTQEPNAAIYALWQNLEIDESSAVRYETVGSAPDRAFVIEFEQLKVGPRFTYADVDAAPTAGRVDLEVKLWESGAIDVLYGDNPANPGDGRNAVIGIEAPDGTDGLVFGTFEGLVSSEVAYRYEPVPNGMLHGVVTDANDGLPVAHATVTAWPGGRSATTAEDGSYQLRLRPGTYTIAFGGRRYADHDVEGYAVADGDDLTLDAVLDGAVADVSPSEIDVTVPHGASTQLELVVDDPGAVDLEWTLFERVGDVVRPELPPVPEFIREIAWAPAELPFDVQTATVHALPPSALQTIIDDPDDDSQGSMEVDKVRAGSDETDMTMGIDFVSGTVVTDATGYVYFDTDQDPETGYPPEWFYGKPGQDIGLEFFADLFSLGEDEPVVNIWSADTWDIVAEVPAVITETSVEFTVPLSAFGDDEDGNIDTAMVIGDSYQPLDWAPDEGHGTIEAFTDIPWLKASASEGVVTAGTTGSIDLKIGGAKLEPGAYTGELVLVSNAARNPGERISVALTVKRPPRWGIAEGGVRDAHSHDRIEGAVVAVHARKDGEPFTIKATSDEDGQWSLQGPQGIWHADVRRDGYVSRTLEVTISADATSGDHNIKLHADVPHGKIVQDPIRLILRPGERVTTVRALRNTEGHRSLDFTIGEVDLTGVSGPGGGGGGGGEEPPGEPAVARTLPAGVDPDARTAEGIGYASPASAIAEVGDALERWPTEMRLPWGVGYRAPGTVTISDPEDLIDVDFTTDGTRQNEYELDWADAWGADMAYDPTRDLIWQVNVGGDNGIYGLDPADGTVEQSIVDGEWTGISQRGLAYDPATDSFYIGGWNEGIIYHIAGPSWPEPGATIDSCNPDDSSISGLAWNPAFHMLWVATNSRNDLIWLVDPNTCRSETAIDPPWKGRYDGAGIELDPAGNIWAVSMGTKDAYLIESGLPTFSDVPWLSVAPRKGEVRPGRSLDLAIRVDTEGLKAGLHPAMVAVVTDDPKLGVGLIPIELVVTRYQRNVNVGGGALSFADGTSYVADRRFSEGSYGYVGDTTVRKVAHAIAGTPHSSVYRSQRQGLTEYRFTVPDGRYHVELGFAELTSAKEFGRVMDVFLQGRLVLDNLDVAGQAGRWRAVDASFMANVSGGILKVRFDRAFGKPPILNAIRVTWLPQGVTP